MGQRFNAGDSIGTLSQSLGVITLAASKLTIGGQQYKTSALTVTPSLTASKMYCLYVVISSGIPTLVSSLNVNSVGPAGFTSWKLVGAFTTKYNSTFADFLSIEGLPVIKAWLLSGSSVTPNINVAGFVDMNTGTDNWGIYTPNSGAYTGASGTFATQNPRIINPIANATVKINGVMNWTPTTANVTNNWDILINRNGSLAASYTTNSWGSNQTNLSYLKEPFMVTLLAQAVGDLYEIYSRNNHGAHPTNMHQVEVEIVGVKQIRDM